MKQSSIRLFALLIFTTLINSCHRNELRGLYYSIENKEIFAFQGSNLTIYNIIDSTKVEYDLKVKESSLIIKNKDEDLIIDSINTDEGFKLIDEDLKVFDSSEINLIKINSDLNLDIKDFYDIYWGKDLPDKKTTYLFKIPKDKYTGYGYKNSEELEDNEFYFQDKFHFNSEMIFNKFFICQFQNIEFSNSVFLIESISLNSLILKDLNSNKILEFTKYNFPIIVSKPNYNLVGKRK